VGAVALFEPSMLSLADEHEQAAVGEAAQASPGPSPSSSAASRRNFGGGTRRNGDALDSLIAGRRAGQATSRGSAHPPSTSQPAAAPAVPPGPPAAAQTASQQQVSCTLVTGIVAENGQLVEKREEACSDGSRRPVPSATPPPAAPKAHCDDREDNDSDGKVDRDDPGCESLSDDSEADPAPAVTNAQCEDGLDNDGDGTLDMMDTGCAEAADTTEADPPTPPRLPRQTVTMGSITTATAWSTQRIRAAKQLAQRLRPPTTSIAVTASTTMVTATSTWPTRNASMPRTRRSCRLHDGRGVRGSGLAGRGR
jgi:hypothetical protein